MTYSEFTPTKTAVHCQRCALPFTRTTAAAKFCAVCSLKRKRERDAMYHRRAK